MAVITPQTDIILLKVPFTLDNNNQLKFADLNSQLAYFNNLPQLELNNATYVRENGYIKFTGSYDDVINYNYVMYQNEGYSNKWFFAFITEVVYLSNSSVGIKIKTDVWQTWMHNITFKRSFVEREHVNDDTTGIHTVPENLELGEYISNGFTRDNELDTLVYLVQSTEYTTGQGKPISTNLGGVHVPGVVYMCETAIILANVLQAFQNGREDAIINVYIVPKKIVRTVDNTLQVGMTEPITYNIDISKQITLDGYTPKNKKLLTYPYNFLIIDNNNGVSNILQYEMFSTSNCSFEVAGVPTVGGSIKCTPLSYKGETRYQQEGIMCGKFPTCGWVNDTYTNWLTQNAVNIGLGIASSGLQIVGGVMAMSTGAGAGMGASAVLNGGLGVAQTLGQVYQHSILPNSARGNVNGGDITTSYNMNKFYFIKMSIKNEYARIIDNYFNMYGYKINSLKIPNITGRQNWNYVKTIGCNIIGDIPQTHLQEIKEMFDNGITLWHNPSNFLDYSQSNNIV